MTTKEQYEWKLTIKGGPGSGNWGHAGRPGQIGGSAPGGGAAQARGKYLQKVRAGYPKPVRDEIAAQVKVAHPGATDHEVDMYLDVMAMDQERFLHYAEKLGIKNPRSAMDAYFAENSAVDKEVMRRRFAVEEAATFTLKDKPDVIRAQDERWDAYAEKYGDRWSDAKIRLEDEFGVEVKGGGDLSVDQYHEQMSYPLNLADAHPSIAKILKERVRSIEFRDNRPGSTAAAEWLGDKLIIYDAKSSGPRVHAHELGHAAEHYAGSLPGLEKMGFGRGKAASFYGWKNHSEDWAEWFSASLEPAPGLEKWDPTKYGAVRGLIDSLGG